MVPSRFLVIIVIFKLKEGITIRSEVNKSGSDPLTLSAEWSAARQQDDAFAVPHGTTKAR